MQASHIFSTKNTGIFQKLTSENLKFNESLTNDIISFEQPGPVSEGFEPNTSEKTEIYSTLYLSYDNSCKIQSKINKQNL